MDNKQKHYVDTIRSKLSKNEISGKIYRTALSKRHELEQAKAQAKAKEKTLALPNRQPIVALSDPTSASISPIVHPAADPPRQPTNLPPPPTILPPTDIISALPPLTDIIPPPPVAGVLTLTKTPQTDVHPTHLESLLNTNSSPIGIPPDMSNQNLDGGEYLIVSSSKPQNKIEPPTFSTSKHGKIFDRFLFKLIEKRDKIQLQIETANLEKLNRSVKKRKEPSESSCIYTVVEGDKSDPKRSALVKLAYSVIDTIKKKISTNEDVIALMDHVVPLFQDIVEEEIFKIGVSSAEGSRRIEERYSCFFKKAIVKRFDIAGNLDNKSRLGIEKRILSDTDEITPRVSGYSGKFECFKLYDKDGECLLPKAQRRIRRRLANDQSEIEEEQTEEEQIEEEEGETTFQSSQSQRNFITKGLHGLNETQYKQEVKDVFKAITFLHENATVINNTVDILWIGCNNFEVIKRVLLLIKRLNLDCHIFVIERDNVIEVPFEMKSCITFLKEEFLHFSCCDLFDLIYSSVNGSASSVFNLKLLCCCCLYCKPNLLLLCHELLFEQVRTLQDQSSGKKEKQLFSDKEQKELQSFVRAEYKYLWKDFKFWCGKEYVIGVSKLLFEVHCIP